MRAWEAGRLGCQQTRPLYGSFIRQVPKKNLTTTYLGACAVGAIMVGGQVTKVDELCRLWPILASPICLLDALHFVCPGDAQLWLWLSLSYEGYGYSRERCIELLRKIEEIAEQVEREWAAWAQLKEFEVAVYADLERISAPVV